VRACFHDPQYYFAILCNILATISSGGLRAFPVLVYSSFGFDALQSVLHGLPSSAIGWVFILLTAFGVNRFPKLRFPAASLWNIVPMIIFPIRWIVERQQ